MPRPASPQRSWPFVVRLISVLLTGALMVPLGDAGSVRPPFELAAPNLLVASLAGEPLSPEPRVPPPLPPDPPPVPPQEPIQRCSDVPTPPALSVSTYSPNKEANEWGEITVAQPKIWQFERVSSLLDGLLRDVEGVSLNDLTQLNPNAQNAAAVKFVQSALEVGVQYDQAAAVNAQNALANYQAIHNSQLQQLNAYNTYMNTLTAERDRVAAQYMAATNEVNALNALKAAGPLSADQTKELEEATNRQTSTQASLTSVNSLISGAGAAPTLTNPPTVTGTTVQQPASGSTMNSSLSSFADVLNNLPAGVKTNLSAALASPTYPATKQLDNFITLLYERLAREVSVLQDDLTRDPENEAFLLQFDVGLYPSKKASDHVARVEFQLDCPGCKVYSLYPGQSAYNLANYSGASKRNSFWGNIATLFGLGLSASYRRQVDTLEGSLVQSVYTAGFLNGVAEQKLEPSTNTNSSDASDKSKKPNQTKTLKVKSDSQSFGWYYGPAPFEKLVSPGIRSTFALVTVPRNKIENFTDGFGNIDACVSFQINGAWPSRNDPLAQDYYLSGVGKAGEIFAVPAYIPRRRVVNDVNDDGSGTWESHHGAPTVVHGVASVKLPAPMDDVPLVARREKKLHVVRMEYNTVFESSDSAPPPKVTTSSTSSTTSASSVTPAPGSTTSNTTVTTSTTSPTVAPAPAATPASSNPYDVLPCPKDECSGMLLRLDRRVLSSV